MSEQEQPVAWRAKAQCGMYSGVWEFSDDRSDLINPEPLYTHPPRSDAWIKRAMELADEYAHRRTLHEQYGEPSLEPDAARAALEAHLKS